MTADGLRQCRRLIGFDHPFELISGGSLRRLDLAIETYGRLDQDHGNAILVCHGLTGSQNAAGRPLPDGPARPWWDVAIGPGRMLDTDRYFIICANVPGGCAGSTGPGSIDPQTGHPFGMRFPRITIADMADALALLLDRLDIHRLHAAIGGCMGGFQVLELARRHPTRLARAIAISATPATSAYTIALWEVMRQAIYADPAWQDGDYYGGPGPLAGVGLGAMIGSVLWLDRDTLAEKFGRRPREDSADDLALVPSPSALPPEFAVETFLARVRRNASLRFDPNALIHLTRAVDLFDLAAGHGDLRQGVAAITAPMLLVSYEADWRYPRDEIAKLACALQSNGTAVSHCHLHSTFGHGAFQFEVDTLAPAMREFLAQD